MILFRYVLCFRLRGRAAGSVTSQQHAGQNSGAHNDRHGQSDTIAEPGPNHPDRAARTERMRCLMVHKD